jgi:flagellar motor protein MotB
MPIRRSRGDDGPKANWLLTYGCLVTQLLVFFVMLFALANKTTEYQLKDIKKRVDAYVQANRLENFVFTDLSLKEKGLVIALADTLMFAPGQGELASDEARRHIAAIMKEVSADDQGRPYPNRVAVEGHTDNRPVRNNAQFASNWELSAARATNVARFVIESVGFPPERLSSSGYAEWQPAAVNLADVPKEELRTLDARERVRRANDTAEKQARNRRVELVVRKLELWELQAWRDELLKAVQKAVGKR